MFAHLFLVEDFSQYTVSNFLLRLKTKVLTKNKKYLSQHSKKKSVTTKQHNMWHYSLAVQATEKLWVKDLVARTTVMSQVAGSISLTSVVS